ncbi:hypothetical protein J437_LFUL016575, partial [Ladona fulva]
MTRLFPLLPTMFVHTPNLLVSNTCCDGCISKNVDTCDSCGVREHVFSSDDPVRDFIRHIEILGENNRYVTCIAHNSKGYDGVTVYRLPQLSSNASIKTPKIEIFLASTGVDPFREAVTIASACMKVFRRNFLKPETLAIIPPGGYRMADRQSRKALLWLTWEEKERGITIRHAGNGREVRILGRKMDGVHEGTVFEFHGCYFHGCTSCFPNRDKKIPNSPHETMGTRYEATEKKIAKLVRGGYDVVEMWECTFDRLVKENVILSNFINSNPLSMESPINPRDAFFGGRTNCVRLYHDADVESGEVIRYLDVCSLYPYVNKYKKYPIGQPEIFVEDICPPLQDIEGLVKCTVLPPPSLYHPVLPFRANGKLLFPLCRSCALNEQQGECKHSKSERFLTGTWVSEEVKVAVREGYEVIKMHEVWHYERTTVYDPATGE